MAKWQQPAKRLYVLSWLPTNRAVYACLFLFLMMLIGVPHTNATAVSQIDSDPTPRQQAAQALLANMSVEERVGQLFMVTFQGDIALDDSDIADLILNYRIGGVVLTNQNDNITGYGNLEAIPDQVAFLNNNLQNLALLGTANVNPDPIVEEGAVPPDRNLNAPQTPIPLFIAIAHEGDGYPNSEILNGVTAVPNNMAIGATWDPNNAQTVGEIIGEELSAIGINLLMGPSLDVLEQPATAGSTLGPRTFGGDPYWVGLMAQAYTSGVHIGSGNRIAVMPKHFPGFGSSDRILHDEVPTVRKSLEQLKQIELAPFFAVTNQAIGTAETADALLATHIRYQGFQGNIRATTNPVSFDQQALATLMTLDTFADWRQGGGLIVSDALGVRAVKRFYDDTGQTFPHRVIAKDAFLAGNDLLYLADFALEEGDYATELFNIKDTIDWFRERYINDQAFQVQVDTAVLRILELKLRLYDDNFSSDNIAVDAEAVTAVAGQNNAAVFEIAQEALTLIFPTVEDLTERLPQPPGSDDRIVIFTDVRTVQQCSICPEQSLIGTSAIEERILALYGPESSGQVRPQQIESFTFSDLQTFLDSGPGPILLPTPVITATETAVDPNPSEGTATPSPTPTPPPEYLVQEALRNANWIIFGMLDEQGDSEALSNFLQQRPDIVRESNVIAFAYNAPYYLDSTEISQLSAFIGIYSKSTEFIDTSVRALFQELPFSGASPMDVPGIRYDLFTQTQPDPGQIIQLFVIDAEENPLTENDEPLDVSVGDTLNLRTGVVLDYNQNPVPDGTLVRFIQQDRVEGSVNIIDEVPTQNGVAELNYVLESSTESGQFRITAESGDARVSIEVNIAVGATEGGAQISLSTPVPSPTTTPTSTPTQTTTPTPTSSATPTPTETPVPPVEPEPEPPAVLITLPEFQMLFAVFSGLGIVGTASLLISQRQMPALRDKIGILLWSIVGALVLYNYFALSLPGAALLAPMGSWAGLLTTLGGGLIGLFAYQFRH